MLTETHTDLDLNVPNICFNFPRSDKLLRIDTQINLVLVGK